MNSDDFNIETALLGVKALKEALESRVHKRKNYFGEEIHVPGTLGDAVQLPKITRLLNSRTQESREKGLVAFQELWQTLSPSTREAVEESIGWYEPSQLEWEDKRSNRRPNIEPDK